MDDNEITALILCGGKGTRLQGLYPDTPKPFIPVEGKPFVAWLVSALVRQGFFHFQFAAGHHAEVVEAWAASTPMPEIPNIDLRVLKEPKPLGTGGGILSALSSCCETVLAMNGDSMLLFDLAPMQTLLAKADMVMAGVYQADCARYGSLKVGDDGMLENYNEKQPGEGFINGGIYLFRKRVLNGFPFGVPLSMEYDLIPALLKRGLRIAVHRIQEAPFLDIGLPETLAIAPCFIRDNAAWFLDAPKA